MALLDRGTAPEDTAGLIQLHQSIAALLADRGEWRQAYEHARHALDIISAERAVPEAPPAVPEQFREEVARLRREHAEAREQAIRDALTASYNRRYLDQRLVALVEQRGACADGLAVALVDLDWFKQVNDTYGHQIGDRVLQRVVELLQDGLPAPAFCARYGGEEFVLVIPGVDGPAAVAVAEAARARVEHHPWSSIALGLRVTVSIGLAYEPPADQRPGATPEAQLRHADRLLYAAKQAGRNAVAYHLDGETRLAGDASGRRGAGVRRAMAH
ncbi:MAG TPA: GGDEF domain-containing protein [Actinophytocola sp.]|uniref:GGDEF domain-containing protein n=1 Tax=Actinophytocola sp. TaxID=1872138 RepID=UPI002DDD43F1|nr:GGDEF domain-containing protein [Actinophytocola sp.]HEV2780073.1 GGDEF domain-containing protein [Actinophytocola sp.]